MIYYRIERGGVIVEPGIYVEELGGFRHSNTILVTKDGFEFITHYPDQLDNLVIEV